MAARKKAKKKTTKRKATKRKATKKKTAKRKPAKKKTAKRKPAKKKTAAKKRPAKRKKAAKKKRPAKKKTAKRKTKKKTKRKAPASFKKPMQPDAVLGAVVGHTPMPRSQVTKKIWAYIKRRGLQDKRNRRMINADDKLLAVFGGKRQVSMFEMTKLYNTHLS